MSVWALQEPSPFKTISSHGSSVWRVAQSIRSTRLGLVRYWRANFLSTRAGKMKLNSGIADRGLFIGMPSRYRPFCRIRMGRGSVFSVGQQIGKLFSDFFHFFCPSRQKSINSWSARALQRLRQRGSDRLTIHVVHQRIVADQPDSSGSTSGAQADTSDRRVMFVCCARYDERAKLRAG